MVVKISMSLGCHMSSLGPLAMEGQCTPIAVVYGLLQV